MNLVYHSTRNSEETATASEAILKGLTSDGGLFVPDSIPKLNVALEDLTKMSYQEIAYAVMKEFLTDFTEEELKTCINNAYDSKFDTEEIAVTKKVDGAYYLELFHGATIAFKDMALSLLPHLMTLSLKQLKEDREVMILAATSGDTGKAALEGFKDVEGTCIKVFYPLDGVSAIQQQQMVSQEGKNVKVVGIHGNFDDAQSAVKVAFGDKMLKEVSDQHHVFLSSANSINVGRLIPQIVYYFHSYFELVRNKEIEMGDQVNFCVPSGNFGNITAGLFGKKMGLPVKRFIAANNRNDIFYQYLQTGKYNPRPSIATIANAMDVGDPSNFARVLDLYNGSHAAISAEISGTTYTDEQIREMVKETWKEHHYLLDPHGACGYRALVEGLKEGETGVFLETAHPAKFLETVESIIGEAVEIPAKLQEFMKGEKKSLQMTKEFVDFKSYLLSL